MKEKKKFEGKVIILGVGSVGAAHYKSLFDKPEYNLIPIDADHRELISMTDSQREQLIKNWDAAYPKFHEEAGKFPDIPLIFGTSGSITTFNTPEHMDGEEYFMRNFLQIQNPDGGFSKPFFRDIDKLILSRPRKFGKTHAFNAMKNYSKWRALELKNKYNRGKNNPPL